MKAKRIQRKRSAGWRKPEGAVNCARPGKFGNPFVHVGSFERWLKTGNYDYFDLLLPRPHKDDLDARREEIISSLDSLRGRELMCWCGMEKQCHVDVLVEMANQEKVV